MKRPGWARRHEKKLVALAAVLLLPAALHHVVGWVTRLPAPELPTPRFEPSQDPDGARRTPKGWTVVRGVRLVYLAGTPEEIGAAHTALVRDRMEENERVLWDGFTELVPFSPARALMFDIGRVRYRNVVSSFPDPRRRELAAEANAFTPDPYAGHLPTYQRMVMLHALYDIALGFEHSPLLACTTFGLGPETTVDGHTIFARAFDFEAADVFDRDKAVFLVHEDGKIPFASVAWPGFVGVVTGMNAEGVAVAVHGGRAREPSTTGVPVAFALREVLQSARTVDEAIGVLARLEAMVSHLVFLADGEGHFAVVERAPGVPQHVRTSFTHPSTAAVTNHFEGPLKGDPRDDRVRQSTTTLPRRARIDELLGGVPAKSATVPLALELLRDHGCAGTPCLLGDRRSIDAFIATHGVVADLTTRTLWVSEGPRLSGRFVKIDPRLLVRREDDPSPDVPTDPLETLPPDPALGDGRYREGRARAGGPLLHPDPHSGGGERHR